jgi:hypothetical protein
MSTLGTLKAEIADDLSRSDLTTAIASEIGYAIEFYQKEHLFFKEDEENQFSTVADQVYYSESDDTDIGLIVSLEALKVRVSNNDYNLIRLPIDLFETLNDPNASSGQPANYVYYNKQIGLYPPPDAVYTVMMIGNVKVAAPAADGEANNVWMTDGYKLIRAHTLSQLSRFKTREYDYADRMEREAARQLDDLRAFTAKNKATNRLTPVQF